MSLRAKIDMASPEHERCATLSSTESVKRLTPPDRRRLVRSIRLYDFTHGQSDSIERITHSLCTLEFENHRPLYDWFLDRLAPVAGDVYASRTRQIEFARLESDVHDHEQEEAACGWSTTSTSPWLG